MPSTNFKVSVIMPVYNAEAYLRKAVESAVHLEEVGEIIIIEDKSPDNALELAKQLEHQFEKVKVFQHADQQNHGAGASRNLGIENARFEYIAFLDADDYYLPNRFIKDKLVFQSNSQADGVYNAIGIHYYSEHAKKQFLDAGYAYQEFLTINEAVPHDELFSVLFYAHKTAKGEFSTIGITVKKTIFKKIGYFHTDLKLQQDVHMWKRMAAFCHLEAGELKSPVAIRGVHGENRMTRPDEQKKYRDLWWQSLKTEFKKNRLEHKKMDLFEQAYHNYYTNSSNKPKAIKSLIINVLNKPKILVESNSYFDFNFWNVFGKNKFTIHTISAKNRSIMYLRIKYHNIKKLSKSKLHYTKKFKSIHSIMPLGCDCHGAYVLNKLGIRDTSYPFDWLNTQPLVGFEYINKQIETEFEFFLQNLEINTRGHVVSKHCPDTEFMHNFDLIEGGASIEILSRRAHRFLETYKSKNQHFLYGFPLKALQSEREVENFMNSVVEFIERLYPTQLLYIYIIYENEPGDLKFYEYLIQSCHFNQVRFVLFEKSSSQGPWGNEDDYPNLINKLKINGYYYPRFKITN